MHTGTPLLTHEGYVGGDVHRAARIGPCGHGGQVLVSSSTAQLVELELADLGEHRLKDLSRPERICLPSWSVSEYERGSKTIQARLGEAMRIECARQGRSLALDDAVAVALDALE